MLLGSDVRRRFDGSFDFKHGERHTIEGWLIREEGEDAGREREQRYQGGEATSSGATKKTAVLGWRRNQRYWGGDSKGSVMMLSKGPAVTVRDQRRQ
ncbi:hypothetical protein ACOSQ3_016995 [Xanthoceras sorbifolium]